MYVGHSENRAGAGGFPEKPGFYAGAYLFQTFVSRSDLAELGLDSSALGGRGMKARLTIQRGGAERIESVFVASKVRPRSCTRPGH